METGEPSRMMVMPPIYHFDLEHEEARKWGWHKAEDLLEVANNIRTLQGLPHLTALELAAEYPEAAPLGQRVLEIDPKENILCDCHYGTQGAPKWLVWAIEKGRYLPAKIGIRLLRLVKDPTYRAYAKMCTAMGKLLP